MITAGDEIGRTQRGNNNAYCQDNDLNWLDWKLSPDKERLLAFTRYLAQVRRQHPALRNERFFTGTEVPGLRMKDVTWYGPTGVEIRDSAWGTPGPARLGVRIVRKPLEGYGKKDADTLFLMVNTGPEPVRFVLPDNRASERWERLFDGLGRDE